VAMVQFLNPATVFWVTNIALISVGVGLLVAYINAISDAFRNRRRGMTAGHLLACGLFINWVGITMRQLGWFVSGYTPEQVEWWLVAMVLSFCGGLLHIAAVESVEATWAPRYFLLSAMLAMAASAGSLLWIWLT